MFNDRKSLFKTLLFIGQIPSTCQALHGRGIPTCSKLFELFSNCYWIKAVCNAPWGEFDECQNATEGLVVDSCREICTNKCSQN